MTPKMSLLAQLELIKRLILEIKAEMTLVEETHPHTRRVGPRPRGEAFNTLTSDCDPSCPTCARGRVLARELYDLGRLLREVFVECGRSVLRRSANRSNAHKKRGQRGVRPETVLRRRGLECVLNDYPMITGEQLWEKLEVDPLTFEDDDIELRIEGDAIIVRNLKANAEITSVPIARGSLRKYIADARKT